MNLSKTKSFEPLLIELLVEELPPKSLNTLGESFAHTIYTHLVAQGFCDKHVNKTVFASPRRLGILIDSVANYGSNQYISQKLMPATIGLHSDGKASPTLLKKLAALGASDTPIDTLIYKEGSLFLEQIIEGNTLIGAMQIILTEALTRLPIAKLMQYQLHQHCDLPGWSTVNFVRPAHGLVALYGNDLLPLTALGLIAQRTTKGHRFQSLDAIITLNHAKEYESILHNRGSVIANFNQRKTLITQQFNTITSHLNGLNPIEDEALLDEVTALVEYPHVLLGSFDPKFLTVPQECLILTMKANQKCFPLLDKNGILSHYFLMVSNINPINTNHIITGNERVIKARLSDAQFFFEQDKKKPLDSRIEHLTTIIYHNQLGTQFDRTHRVAKIAQMIAMQLSPDNDTLAIQSHRAAILSKSDLLTDMVSEFPELQGTMGKYYALYSGENPVIADAIEDHYKPKFSGDTLPRNTVGTVLALADKLETLVGLFGIGAFPTGEKDPFALRRHALGIIRLLIENALPLHLNTLLNQTEPVFATGLLTQPIIHANTFIYERLSGQLRDQGYNIQIINAVLSQKPSILCDINTRLDAVKLFLNLPEAPALIAANKRVSHILKKTHTNLAQASDIQISNLIDSNLLIEDAEQALFNCLNTLESSANTTYISKQYTQNLQLLAQLKLPIDAFFEQVMVNIENDSLRLNRQNLLRKVHAMMNQIADLNQLSI